MRRQENGMNLNRLNILIFLIMIAYPLMDSKANADVLPTIILNGDNGGLCGGKEWKSSSLQDKVNLVLYVDPDRQSWAKPLVTKLDSLKYSPDSLGITFILNTDATIIPDFIIRNRVRAKAKTSTNMTYVLDRKKMLVRKWNLADDDINVLLMDASGEVVQQHHGEMTGDFITQLLNKIEDSINKGELK